MSTPNNNTELSALFGAGPACAVLSVVFPAALLGYAIASLPGQAVPLGAVVAFILFVRAAWSGRSDAMILGIGAAGLLFAFSDAGFIAMAVAGAVLFVTFILHDLSRSLRRRPAVSSAFVRGLATSTIGVIVIGWLLAAAASAIAGATIWPALLVPVAVVAIGLFAFLSLQGLITRNEAPGAERS